MNKILTAGRFQFDMTQPVIMGILNVTTDSFSDGGKFNNIDRALTHAEQMLSSGADIIDIGAESTRPGACEVDEQTELSRVIPIIRAINNSFDCCISIDTYKPKVMEAVIAEGVSMINDVKGFTNNASLEAVSNSNAAICIMHMQGTPQTMQQAPSYTNIIHEVSSFLESQASLAIQAGVDKNRIVIDPGFGFGKTAKQNLALLNKINELNNNYPMLCGLSRKSTLGVILEDEKADRTIASVVAAIKAIENGAHIVRVHDVKETKQAIKVITALANH